MREFSSVGVTPSRNPGQSSRPPRRRTRAFPLRCIVDTSILIDGKIATMAQLGFLPWKLMIPWLVVGELRNMVEFGIAPKQVRGKRGLAVLEYLQRLPGCSVVMLEAELPSNLTVDMHLVHLARTHQIPLMTNDVPLQEEARSQGVAVLSISALAHGLRPLFLPGDSLKLQITEAGKEPEQGRGFLEDGTMVVVEKGRKLVGQEVTVTVSRVLRTEAGDIIFVDPSKT